MFRRVVIAITVFTLFGLVAPQASAQVVGTVPGRFCKSADIGKKMKTSKYGMIQCKQDGNRARWKRI